MNVQPTLELHPEFSQTVNPPQGSDSCGCCCFWRAKSKKQYTIDENYVIKKVTKTNYHERIQANQRLAHIVKNCITLDPINSNDLFERLKTRINIGDDCDEYITSERLAEIVNRIYEMYGERDVLN